MKKFITLLILSVIALATVLVPNRTMVSTCAASNDTIGDNIQYVTSINNYLNEFVGYGSAQKTRVNRFAGSVGERNAAAYIAAQLEALGLEGANSDSIVDGIQEFDFFNQYSGKKQVSQNVVFTLHGAQSNGETATKTVVLCCNYDNGYSAYLDVDKEVYTAQDDYSEGINASAASVATLLALAENLPEGIFPFDVQFVFWGASSASDAGANFYSSSLSPAQRADTLLIIDISRIALGSDVYYYTGEFGSKQNNFYKNCGAFTSVNKYSSGFAGTAQITNTELGYYNAGYNGATAVLSNKGINVLHIFAGNYSEGLFAGFQEYYGSPNITDGAKDNLDYIMQTYGQDYLKNASKAATSIASLLSVEGFVEAMQMKSSNTAFNFFTNTRLHVLLTALVLIALLVISIVLHYCIFKRSYSYAFNNKLKGIMLTCEIDDDKDLSA